MKYLIIGAGGTGGAIAGYLKKAGVDAEIIARGRALEEIRKNGLTVKTKKYGDFNVNIDAYSMEEYAGKPDVIIVCVKYYSLLEVKEFLKRTAADETLVIPVLNVFTTGKELSQGLSSTVFDGCHLYLQHDRKTGSDFAADGDFQSVFRRKAGAAYKRKYREKGAFG